MANEERSKRKLARSTQERYAKTAGRLLAKFEEENNCKLSDDPQFLREWLINELSGKFSARTIRVYRSALHYALGKSGVDIDIPDLSTGQSGNRAGLRAKRLPDDIIDRMMKTAFYDRFGIHARIGVTIMFCSRHFGLRPIEWFGAVYDDEEKQLLVKNAKHSRGRSFGEYRTLHVSEGMPDRVLEAVRWLLDTIAEQGFHITDLDDHDPDVTRLMADAVRRVHDKCFAGADGSGKAEPRFTLYSGRHQFAAHAKAAGLSKIEIAALMGHASPETAGEHYGRRTAGRAGGIHVEPDEGDIQAVERIVFAKKISQTPSFV
jgi:integrase